MNLTDLPRSLAKRIAIDPTTGCWKWMSGTAGKGYAYGYWAGGMSYIHRVTYHLLVDSTLPIRGAGCGGMCIDHLCQNRICVNPAHLELVTWSTNLSRWHQEHPERLEHARTFRRNSKHHLSVVPPIEADPTPAHGVERPVVAS